MPHLRRTHLALIVAAFTLATAQAQTVPQREVAAPSGSEMGNRGTEADASVTADQLRTVEQSLRQTREQLAGQGGPPDPDRARTAVVSGQSVLARIPQERRGVATFAAAQDRLAEARRALEAPRLDPAAAGQRLDAAAAAVAALSAAMGGPTAATQAVGGR